MTSAMRDTMMPAPSMQNESFSKESQRYESTKQFVMMDLSLIESCMGKCQVNFSSGDAAKLNGSEQPCMQKCYNKFFDSSLLIDKELTMYTVGNPYV